MRFMIGVRVSRRGGVHAQLDIAVTYSPRRHRYVPAFIRQNRDWPAPQGLIS
ncbi:MAG: hypothetical protein ACYDBW_06425 [Sulfuricaulis sp.]